MISSALEQKFEGAMFDIFRRAKSAARYNASAFLGLPNERGGLATAKALVNASKQSDGFTALHLAGRLDLIVEALVVEDNRWRSLFLPEEIEKARVRPDKNGYTPKPRN